MQKKKAEVDADSAVFGVAALESVNSDAPQSTTAPGSVATPASTPDTPTPSATSDADPVVMLSSVADAAPVHDSSTKGGILALLRERLPVLPHGDRAHVQALIDLVDGFNDDVEDTIEDTLEAAMVARNEFENKIKYLLKQLQADNGYLHGVFRSILG